MAKIWQILLYIILGSLSLSCIKAVLEGVSYYDTRKIHVMTLSLFNQRRITDAPDWKGDWIFRRERLEILDQKLRSLRPELLILQEIMHKRENIYDSDQFILGAGALRGFEWQNVDIEEYLDHEEIESISVVSTYPLRSYTSGTRQKQLFKHKSGGLVAFFATMSENQPITIANVKFPNKDVIEWLDFLKNQISNYFLEFSGCHRRLVVSGYISSEIDDPHYQNWLDELELIDSTKSFCEEDSCVTASSENPIYKKAFGETLASRSDRILVHKSTLLYEGQRTMDEMSKSSPYIEKYKLKELTPTARYGWLIQARFSRCPISSSL